MISDLVHDSRYLCSCLIGFGGGIEDNQMYVTKRKWRCVRMDGTWNLESQK